VTGVQTGVSVTWWSARRLAGEVAEGGFEIDCQMASLWLAQEEADRRSRRRPEARPLFLSEVGCVDLIDVVGDTARILQRLPGAGLVLKMESVGAEFAGVLEGESDAGEVGTPERCPA